MTENNMIAKLEEGQAVIGCWSLMGSPEAVEMIGYSGFDFVIIDRQHTYFGLDTTESMLRAAELANVTPIIRVPDSTPSGIMKALDAGAAGILVPLVSSAHEAELIVQAAKYPPVGNRSACPETRALRYGSLEWQTFVESSNRDTMVWLIVEGPEGIASFQEIANVEGVHGIVIGPFDLAQCLGHPGQPDHPEVVRHMDECLEMAKGTDVKMIAAIFDTDPDRIKEKVSLSISRGYNIMTVASDRTTLLTGLTSIAERAREAT